MYTLDRGTQYIFSKDSSLTAETVHGSYDGEAGGTGSDDYAEDEEGTSNWRRNNSRNKREKKKPFLLSPVDTHRHT